MRALTLLILIILSAVISGCNNPKGGSVIQQGNAPFLQKPAPFAFTQIRAQNGTVDIAWQEARRVANYEFFMGTSSSAITTPVPDCSGTTVESCQITGLDPNTTYYFNVVASNDAGSTSVTSIGRALSVGLFNITSSSPGDRTITVNWANANNATAYNIIYGTVSGSYTQTISNVTSPYVIPNLTNGVRYYVRVVGVNTDNGYSASNNEINAQPYGPLPAPTGLTATATPNQIYLDWNDSAGVTYYKIYKGTSAGSETLVPGGPYTSSNYTDTGLTNGQTYFYYIIAYNDFDSPKSVTISSQPIASFAMTGASASPGPNQATITWNTPVVGAIGYDIQYGTNPAALSSVVSSVTTPYVFNGLTPNLPYYFRVVAKNGVGAGTTILSTNQLSATPLQPLAVPSGLVATANPGQILLDWSDVPGATEYKIYKGTSSGALSLVAGGPYTSSNFTDNSVSNGQPYYYAVRASNGTFDSNLTSEVSKKPISTFSLSSATVQTFSSANITWTAATGADAYDIRYGTASGNYTQISANRSSTATLTGLSGGTQYFVVITARNAVGSLTSVTSNELSFTTTATFPTVTIDTYPLINNANKAAYTVNGTCSENGRVVTVTIGAVSSTPTCTALAWSTTMDVTSVPDSASRTITAVHTNSGGNNDTETRTVVKDTTAPTVTIASYPAINNANEASYTVSGACSENTRTVSVSVGGIGATPTCTSLAWTATVDASGLSDGPVTITADHTDAAGNTATQASRSITKDTTLPSVAISSSPVINNANKNSYTFSGTCSETGENVSVKVGATTGTVVCTLLTWTATLNVSANADTPVLVVTADHSDTAGNAATQASVLVVKDTANPTVTIASAPLINNANKAAYTVSGTCSENTRTVSVSVGGVTATPTCSASAWSATVDVTLVADSGSVSVTASHTDAAGNSGTASTTVVKNTNLPTVAITSSPVIYNANKAAYPVSGTCSENGRPVPVSVGGVTATPTCTTGAWSATLNVAAVADNASVSITANHSDTVGNNANQASTTVLKDTVNPTVAISSSPVINNGNKAAYTVNGTCSEDTRNVVVTVGGVSSTVSCSTTSWSATLNVTAVADNAAVSVSATHSDSAGNTATPASASIVKDTTNPTVAITTYPTINNVNDNAYTVSGSCSENTRQVSVSVGGVTATPTCTALSWSATVNVSGLADNNSIPVTADHTDAAGNSATQATRTVVKDTSLPTVAITSSAVVNNSNKNAYPVSGTCSETGQNVVVNVGATSATVTCTLLTWSASMNVSANADTGSLNVTADHSDTAGNAAVQAAITVVKDTINPTVAITSSPVINNANKAAYTASGTCSETGRIVSINVGGVTATPTCTATAWSATLNVTAVADSGSVSISANHSDSAGNTATPATTTVVKNTALPTVAITSTPVINNANKAAYTVSGTCSESSRTVSVNVGGVAATPTCSGTTWTTTVNVTAIADNGSVSITADHTDVDGNVANQASTTVLKDTVNPNVAITSSPVINNANKGAYPVSGTCSEDTRTVSVNVGGVATNPTCTTGTWTASVNVTAVADNATISITANHTDAALNNASQASASVVKDTAVPTVAITSSPVINNANKASYTVSGTCSENTRQVSVNVGGVTATPSCSGTTWTATVNVTAVADSGAVAITADHSDTAGNPATQATVSVVKDTALPTVAITSSPVINNTNKAAYVVSGTCSENIRSVSVNVGGVAGSPTCTANAWSTTLNVTAVADNASVAITADHSDVNGNSATQATTSVLKDTVIPTVAITSAPDVNGSNVTAYPISGTCSENTRQVSVNVGGVTATPTCSAGAWSASMNVSGLADSNGIAVSANHSDAAGNNATQANDTIDKATALPTVAITAPVAINNTNKAAYPISGTCSENSRTVSINVGGVTATPTCSAGAWSTSLNLTAVADNASVAATADHSDSVGNSAIQASTTILKDTVIPTVTITSSPVIYNGNKAAYTVSGACSENTRQISVNVGGVTSTPTCTALAWSATVNVTAVADSGTVSITANHTDAATNAATQASASVVKDTSNPTVAITSSPVINNANKASYTVNGTCSENTRTVTVSVGGVGATPTCTASAWSATVNVSGVADSATVAITADHTDVNGNSATQATASVIKDTADPTVAITSSPIINNANKASYTVSGTCSENTRTVTVSVGGVGATPTCSSSAWSATVNVTAVGDSATLSITANHSDVYGNSATQATASVLKDTVNPTVGISVPVAINNTNKASYPVSGSCSENTRQVSVNVGGVTATPTCTALAWSTNVNVSGIADSGSVSITANHTDAAANAATQASTTTSKDTTDPTVAITSSGAINNSNKAAYPVSGTCSENTRQVSVNVGGVTATPTCTALAWSTTVNVTALADSPPNITITADHSDSNGNAATQATSSVLKDTVIPTVAITSNTTINNANKAAYVVSGTCSDDTRLVTVNIGSASGSGTCTALAFSATLNVTAVADNATLGITADHSDSAGNNATQATASVVKDTTAPTVAITSSPVINNTNKASYTVSGTCSENTRTVSVNVGGVTGSPSCSAGAWSSTLDVSGVADSGSVSITANHSDAAGNAATQASTSVVKDTTPPTVAITSSTAINNTNKAAYAVTGTCSENTRTVTVNVGGVTATPTCSALAWSTSVNVTAVADNASVTITADHSDTSGNAATQATVSVLKDTVIPTVAITSSPTINNANQAAYTVSGTCSENTRTVTVSVGGVGSTPTCSAGAWSATVNVTAVADSGSVSITANHTDLAGNAATQASTTVIKDANLPTVAISSSPVINNANKAAYTVSGSCSENTRTVTVSVGGVGATPTCSAGSWSTGAIDVSAVADSGTVSITANHSDVNGNSATQASTTVVKDTVIPTVAITSSPAINNTNKASYTISGSCSENTRSVAISVGGVASSATCTAGAWTRTYDVSAAADSATLAVTANHADAAGNSATQASTTVVKDTSNPTVAITSSPVINNSNKTSYTVSGTCSETGRTVTINVGSVNTTDTCTLLTWSATVDVSGNPDSLTLLITADHSDSSGNSAVQAGTTVVKDTAIPTVAINASATINNANRTAYTVTGTCSENTRIVTVSIGGVSASPTCSAGAWTTGAINVSAAADSATLSITANHTDSAGNSATQASITVVKDTSNPTVAITSSPGITLANRAAYTVSGTCSENGRTVSVNVGGVTGTPTCTTGAWSSTLNVTAVADSASVSITANHTDANGNSATQASTTVIKDTTVPTVALSSTAPASTSLNPFVVRATFSEAVTGVTLSDFVVGNGTGSSLNTISTTVYEINVTPTTAGTVTVDMAASAAADAAGNNSSAATQLTRTFVPPAVLAFADATTYDYGTVNVGSTADLTILINKSGTANATSISEVGLAAPFAFKGGAFPGTGGTCTTTITANCSIVVTFTPTANGVRSDTLQINYNDGAVTRSITKDLTGTGLVIVATHTRVDGPAGVMIGQCIAYTVNSTTANGTNANVSAAQTVNLVVNNGAGTFYSNNTCGTTITSTSIAAGTSSTTIYFKATTTGQNLTLVFNPASLVSTNKDVSTTTAPTRIWWVTPAEMEINRCYPLVVDLTDANGTKAGRNVAVTVNLTDGGGAQYYSDSNCTGVITSVAFPATVESKTVYVMNPTQQSISLTGTDAAGTLTTRTTTVSFVNTLNWWNTSYEKRMAITISNLDQATAHTNIPVLVKLDTSKINYADMQSAGQDIRFTLADHSTTLSYDIEQWSTSGDSFIWVRLPSIAASSTAVIYMYYKNSLASDGQTPASAWSGYSGVWNLDKSGSNYPDATGSGKTGVPQGTVTDVTGVIGNAISLNGSSTIDVSYNLALVIGKSSTFSAWMKTSQLGSNTAWQAPGITGVEQAGGGNDIFFGWISGAGRIRVSTGNGNNTESGFVVNDNNWRYVTMSRDETSGQVKFYVNGVLNGSGNSDSGTITTPFSQIGAVADTGGAPKYLNGILDNIRLINSVQTDARIRAEYKYSTQSNISYGSPEDL